MFALAVYRSRKPEIPFVAPRLPEVTSLTWKSRNESLLLAKSSERSIKQKVGLLSLLLLGMTVIAMTSPLTKFDDGTLIKLALAGQAECFTALMDRHVSPVRRRIRSMVENTTDADDLLQEVFLKVWLKLSTFRSEARFRTWMTRIALNEALQLHRRERRGRLCQPLLDFDAFPSQSESPHQCLVRTEVTQAVRSAVARLPAKYSQVLILRDLEQLSARETAQCLKSSIPAVKTRLSRGRLMLLAALHESGNRKLAGAKYARPTC